MNAYRDEGLGWLAGVMAALGAAIVVVNLLELDFWLFSVFAVLPLAFGLILLAVGGGLLLAGLLSGRKSGA